MLALSARNNHPVGDKGVHGVTHAVGVSVDEFCRGHTAVYIGEDWPLRIVEIEDGVHRNQIHRGLVVGIQGTHVAPVVAVAFGGTRNDVVDEVIATGLAARDKVRHDVTAHVVGGFFVDGVLGQGLEQGVGVENIVPHRGQYLVGGIGQPHRVQRFFLESRDLARGIGLDYPKGGSQRERLANPRYGGGQAGFNVGLYHLAEVHTIDVVRPDNQDVVRHFVANDVHRLEDGVRTAHVPVFPGALLGGDGGNIVTQNRRHVPGRRDVAVQ